MTTVICFIKQNRLYRKAVVLDYI